MRRKSEFIIGIGIGRGRGRGRVLAGLKVLLSRLGGNRIRKRKVKIKMMDWWQKMVFPVRRVWVAVSARVKARKNGQFILYLFFFSSMGLILASFS